MQEMEWTRRRWLRWATLSGLAGMGAVPLATWKTSRAFFSPEREAAPFIEITGGSLQVQHRASGSGKLQGTALRGSKVYEFAKEGTYRVEPGRYQHIVYGQVPAGGSIESVIRYQ